MDKNSVENQFYVLKWQVCCAIIHLTPLNLQVHTGEFIIKLKIKIYNSLADTRYSFITKVSKRSATNFTSQVMIDLQSRPDQLQGHYLEVSSNFDFGGLYFKLCFKCHHYDLLYSKYKVTFRKLMMIDRGKPMSWFLMWTSSLFNNMEYGVRVKS